MKEFILKAEDLEVKGFEGEVTLSLPSYKERMKVLKSLNFNLDSKGEVSKNTDIVGAAEKIFDIAAKYCKDVNLVYEETELSSIDDLSYFQEGSEVIQHIGNIIINGVSLGKKSKAP